MSEPEPVEERGRPPGEPKRGEPAGEPLWRSKSLGGAILAVLLGASVVVALYLERKPSLDVAGAVQEIEKRIEAKRRLKWLDALHAACTSYDCACAKKAASLGLDVDAADAVLALVEKTASCAPAEFGGFRAEALIRKGSDREGLEEAARVIEETKGNAYALYATALLTYRARQFDTAMNLAQSSERAGRGWSATLLVGLVAYESGNFERARRAFHVLLKDDPDDVDALWNLAVAAQKENRYGEARSSYLKVARLRPGNGDARYNLALLAHSVGAIDEAQHHFARFEKSAPNDPRIETLRAKLAEAPEHGPAMSPVAPVDPVAPPTPPR